MLSEAFSETALASLQNTQITRDISINQAICHWFTPSIPWHGLLSYNDN
jgi:hypothetical protein